MYAKSIPEGVSIARTQIEPDWVKVTSVEPDFRVFRNAWELSGTTITTNMTKAKEKAHEMRRGRRDELMKPHDEIIMKQIPGQNAQQAEQARATIRNDDALVQETIDLATTPDELKAALVAYGVEL